MSELKSYSYTILRYMHDTTTGEFVNVGVALFSPDARYASALCRSTQGRVTKVFPGINTEHFKSLMRHVQARFEEIGERLSTQLPLQAYQSVAELARAIVPTDDSALQWSPIGVGKTADAAATLETLFDRLVMRYEDKPARGRRTEEDVWRHFKRNLESRQLLHHFEPKTIAVQDDEVEFEYAWKNGIVHCLEPVSFDLSSPNSIRDKAHKWLGKITSVASAQEKFRLYFLVAQPQDDDLAAAFDSALSILGKVPVENMIFREQQVGELTDLLAQEVSDHYGSVSH